MSSEERVAFPYLDTIETSQDCQTSQKPIYINDFQSKSGFSEYEEKLRNFDENNSESIKSAEYYKKLTDDLAALLLYEDSILQDRAEKMLDCGTFLEYVDDKIISANFCRQRICPNCQRRRALKTCVDTLSIQKELDKLGCKYLHVVLTVPNCSADELSNTIDLLYSASSRLFKTKELRNKFKGVMRCLEVTYNSKYRLHTSVDDEIVGNCFHPHLHCLVAVGKSYGSGKNYVSQALLTGLWMNCVGTTDFLNVYVSAVKSGDSKAVAEIAKYCVKPLDLQCSPDERRVVTEVIFSALHSRRLVQFYGLFREVARKLRVDSDNLVDEVKSVDITKVRRYTYNRRIRRYTLV